MSEFEQFIKQFGLVPRPQNDFLDLPISHRWEVSRRHPYYQLFWSMAAKYRRGELGPDRDELMDGYCALQLLGLIGVFGEPVDPAMPFSQLEGSDPSLGSGTVQPMTMRSMLQALIAALPPAELSAAAAAFMMAGDSDYAIPGDDDKSLQRRKAQLYLTRVPSAPFDSYIAAPLYNIHMHAPQRRIVDDLEHLIRRWKKERNIPERRTHS